MEISLPVNMHKYEQKWQTLFNQYLREKRPHGFYELKQTVKEFFPFSKIKLVQYSGLQATEREGLVWKLSDQDQREKPCDTLCIPPLPSYVVIKFPDGFYCIRIGEIVKMKDSGETSITLKQAEKLAEKVIHIRC
jgi:hypothetical protein